MNTADIPPNLVAAITGNAEFPTEAGITAVEWIDVGVFPVPSGRIIACDPIMFGNLDPFRRSIKPGAYPLRLLIAHYDGGDQRIAAAVLVLDYTELPTEWELATTEGQDVNDLGADDIFGYPVDSGTAGFLDLEALDALETAMDDDLEYFQRIVDDMEETYRHTRSWALHPVKGAPDLCVAAFSSGLGDGIYPSYWGLNSRREPLWLITEFGLL